jgi:hypothetical protein
VFLNGDFLQELPNAEKCTGYIWKDFSAPPPIEPAVTPPKPGPTIKFKIHEDTGVEMVTSEGTNSHEKSKSQQQETERPPPLENDDAMEIS